MHEAQAEEVNVGATPRPSLTSQIRFLLGGREGAITILAASSVLAGLTESGVLALVAQIAASLVDGTKHVRLDLGPVHTRVSVGALLASALGLALVRLLLQFVLATVPAHVGADVLSRLRTDLFNAFTRASWGVQSRDREGHFQELATDQISFATGGALQAASLTVALLTFFVLVISALVLNVVAALLVLVAAAGLFAVLRPLSTLGQQIGKDVSESSMQFAGSIGEAVRLAEETEVFGVAHAQRDRIGTFVDKIRKPFFQGTFLARLVPGVYQSLIYAFVIGGLAVLYATGGGHIASLGAVVLLLVRAGSYGQLAQAAYQGLRQSLPYLERVQEAENRYMASARTLGTRPLASISELEFDRVFFAYEPQRPVLADVSFEVGHGEAIGIVGPSGAGKSTLVQILLGLRPPTRGGYLVNGVPAEQFAPDDWHRLAAYVPQDPRLLHATVADNIRFFRGIPDEDVEHAAHLAGIHDEIVAWPHGYDTLIGPRADAVSGGQQQRICLARALAAKPAMLVLDEPTSALDPHSEMLIRESLMALRHEVTLFVVAHRLSTLDVCERIMVIVKGRLEAFGRTEDVRNTNAYYRSSAELALGDVRTG
jgi:ABC-type multidrug transport system fused ATPase/permease subunit